MQNRSGAPDFSFWEGIDRGMRGPIGHGVCATDHLPKQGPDMPLRETLSNAWDPIQGFLFPLLREEAGPLTAHDERLAVVLEVAGVEAFVSMWHGLPGRPLKDRHALARAFVAKAVFGLPTTTALIERLSIEGTLRLCGWERAAHVPGESAFSRAFGPSSREARCRPSRTRR